MFVIQSFTIFGLTLYTHIWGICMEKPYLKTSYGTFSMTERLEVNSKQLKNR